MKRQPICPRCNTQKKFSRAASCAVRTAREFGIGSTITKSAKRRHGQLRNYVENKYGVTVERLEEMFEEQQQCCAICGLHWLECKPSKHSRYELIFLQRLYIDHCHKSGRVRGLLCNTCNTAIAMLKEDPKLFDAAKAYVIRFQSNEKERE